MKALLLLAAFSLPVFAADTTPAPGTGCAWSTGHANCLVANESDQPVTCDVRVQITTTNNQKTTKKKVTIQPKQTEFFEARPLWDDKIERAQIAAICK